MKRTGKRLILALLTLALAVVLMPAGEAGEKLYNGGPCPKCGAPLTAMREASRPVHVFYCYNPACPEYNDLSGDALIELEDCYGGKATCNRGPFCEVCGGEYGERDLNNHDYYLTDLGDGMHGLKCSRCENIDELTVEAHVFKDDPSPDPDQCRHFYACVCGAREYEDHVIKAGTCVAVDKAKHKATCDICGKEYTEEHSGGKATCQSGAKCEKCGEVYTDPDTGPYGHDYQYKDHGDGTHAHVCTLCGDLIKASVHAHYFFTA